jgi:hypothetical protein
MLVFVLIGGVMFVLFMLGGRPILFYFHSYGLGWYKVRGETPQEGFFIFLAWSVGWGGQWGEGVFLAWYGVGNNEISISFTPNSYFWKTSPNSKKQKKNSELGNVFFLLQIKTNIIGNWK